MLLTSTIDGLHTNNAYNFNKHEHDDKPSQLLCFISSIYHCEFVFCHKRGVHVSNLFLVS